MRYSVSFWFYCSSRNLRRTVNFWVTNKHLRKRRQEITLYLFSKYFDIVIDYSFLTSKSNVLVNGKKPQWLHFLKKALFISKLNGVSHFCLFITAIRSSFPTLLLVFSLSWQNTFLNNLFQTVGCHSFAFLISACTNGKVELSMDDKMKTQDFSRKGSEGCVVTSNALVHINTNAATSNWLRGSLTRAKMPHEKVSYSRKGELITGLNDHWLLIGDKHYKRMYLSARFGFSDRS